MKKKLFALLTATAILCTALFSCNKVQNENSENNETPPAITNTENTENTNTENESTNAENVPDFIINDGENENENTQNTEREESMEKETTTFPEERILYTAPENYENFEIVSTFNSSQYSFFTAETKDGPRYGIINMSGEIVVQPTHTLLGYCDWHNVIYGDIYENDKPVVIDEDYKIDLHYGHGGTMPTFYVFDKPAGRMFSYTFNYDSFVTKEVAAIDMLTPYAVYNGTERIKPDFGYDIRNGEIYQTLVEYSLGYNEYEFPDGRITDGAECEFISDIGSVVNLGKIDFISASGFVNDYMIVYKNGKASYINGIGKECTPAIFENAALAFGDRAWVKHNGVWKIINLA